MTTDSPSSWWCRAAAGQLVLRAGCADDPTVERIIGIDARDRSSGHRRSSPPARPRVRRPQAAARGADTVVHLASRGTRCRRRARPSGRTASGTRRVLDAAAGAGSARSSSAVERHRLRRVGEQPRAAHRGRAAAAQPRRHRSPTRRPRSSGCVAEWRDDHPGATVAMLRPATVAVAGERQRMARRRPAARRRSPVARRPSRRRSSSHLDDLAAAVDLAIDVAGLDGRLQRGARRLDHRRDAAGAGRRRACASASRSRSRCGSAAGAGRPGLVATPPALAAPTPCTRGWSPTTGCAPPAGSRSTPTRRRSSAPTEPLRWPELSPRRRQELALGAAAGGSGRASRAEWSAIGAAGPSPPPTDRRAQGRCRGARPAVSAHRPVASPSRTTSSATTSPGWCRTQRDDERGHRRDGLPSMPTMTSRAARPARSAGPPGVTFSTSAPPSTPSRPAAPRRGRCPRCRARRGRPAVGDQLRRPTDRGGVDGRGEAETVAARPLLTAVMMPIAAPCGVEQRAARRARGDRRVGLDHVEQRVAVAATRPRTMER